MTCGNCIDCLARVGGVVLHGQRTATAVAAPRVSAEQLKRHAKKHGWDQVAETAAQMGIDLQAPKKETERAKAARLKKDRAWKMYDDGLTPSEIAERLSVRPDTVRKYLSNP